MDHLTKLLMQARRAKNGKGKHVIGFVDYDPEKKKYKASGMIWDGVPGSGGDNFYSEHDTEEEAFAACETVAAQYHVAENINFVMEYGVM